MGRREWGICKHHHVFYGMGVYHNKAEIHGFSEGVTLGLFWIVVTVAAESCWSLACVAAATGCLVACCME